MAHSHSTGLGQGPENGGFLYTTLCTVRTTQGQGQ